MDVGGVLAVPPNIVENFASCFLHLDIFPARTAKGGDERRDELVQMVRHVVLSVYHAHEGQFGCSQPVLHTQILNFSKDSKPHFSDMPSNEEPAS